MSSSDPMPGASPAPGPSLRALLARIRGGEAPPPAVPLPRALAAGLAGALAIALLTLLAQWSGMPLLLAPFGATCVLIFALPDSPLAQPRAVIGGAPWSFLLTPVLVGSLLLVGCALLVNNLAPGRRYPRQWL